MLPTGSEEELEDLKKAYVNNKGDMNKILEYVLFSSPVDESRFDEILHKWIDSGDVPAFDKYLKEPASRKENRRKKVSAPQIELTSRERIFLNFFLFSMKKNVCSLKKLKRNGNHRQWMNLPMIYSKLSKAVNPVAKLDKMISCNDSSRNMPLPSPILNERRNNIDSKS